MGLSEVPVDTPVQHPDLHYGCVVHGGRGDNTTRWALSSDHMAPGQPKGHTFHADWFGAWDPTVQSHVVEQLHQ